jgi:hypothetical protein
MDPEHWYNRALRATPATCSQIPRDQLLHEGGGQHLPAGAVQQAQGGLPLQGGHLRVH